MAMANQIAINIASIGAYLSSFKDVAGAEASEASAVRQVAILEGHLSKISLNPSEGTACMNALQVGPWSPACVKTLTTAIHDAVSRSSTALLSLPAVRQPSPSNDTQNMRAPIKWVSVGLYKAASSGLTTEFATLFSHFYAGLDLWWPSERTVKLCVATLLLITNTTDYDCNQKLTLVKLFKSQLRQAALALRSRVSGHANVLVEYPESPGDLDAASYNRFYGQGDEAPALLIIDQTVFDVTASNIPLRKSKTSVLDGPHGGGILSLLQQLMHQGGHAHSASSISDDLSFPRSRSAPAMLLPQLPQPLVRSASQPSLQLALPPPEPVSILVFYSSST